MGNNFRVFTIYKFTCLANGKQYVGQTKQQLKDRLTKHRSDSKKPKHAFSRAIKRHGWENFDLDIVAMAFTQHEANRLEQQYIAEFNTLTPNGYNLTEGGHAGFHLTDDQRKQRSENQKRVCKKTRVTATVNGVGISFFSIYEAGDFFGVHTSGIHRALNKVNGTVKNIVFTKAVV